MASSRNYCESYLEYRRRTNYPEVFAATMSKIRGAVNLDSVRCCVTVGPGDGLYEVEFIRQLVPNVEKLVAVERDRELAQHLRSRLAKSLPAVDARLFETDFHRWDGPEHPVDLVLMFDMMYYISRDEMRQLFAKVHGRWLVSGGFLAMVHRSGARSGANAILRRLEKPPQSLDEIEFDLLQTGFVKVHAREMPIVQDFSNPDASLLHFYKDRLHARTLTLDEFRDLLQELYPEGKSRTFRSLTVFKKEQQ